MGTCLGKGGQLSDKQALDRCSQMTRQTSPRFTRNEDELPADNSLAALLDTTSAKGKAILDLFPKQGEHLEGRPGYRFSILGQPPKDTQHQQKEFSDKQTSIVGTRTSGDSDLFFGYACKKGLKPEIPNQDDFTIFGIGDLQVFGVFDGHGPTGHDVSNFVHEVLPQCLVRDRDFSSDPPAALRHAFSETQEYCSGQPTAQRNFDCNWSGCTATVVVLRGQTLHAAHVGDSRAVLARSIGGIQRSRKSRRPSMGEVFAAEDLTKDHKPTNGRERKRIEASGGVVMKQQAKSETSPRPGSRDLPHRVFAAGKTYPGLAMSRSIGDMIGQSVGVVSIPDVKVLTMTKDWRFMLICSDGVWEFLTSQQAVDIVSKYAPAQAQQAADELAAEAWNCWIKEEEGKVVDDITVVCVYFNTPGVSPEMQAELERFDSQESPSVPSPKRRPSVGSNDSDTRAASISSSVPSKISSSISSAPGVTVTSDDLQSVPLPRKAKKASKRRLKIPECIQEGTLTCL